MATNVNNSRASVLRSVLDTVLESTKYNGLDLSAIRKNLAKLSTNINERNARIATYLVIYSRCGTNSNKLRDKISNLSEGAKYIRIMSDDQVRMKAERSDTLTLPRIAIAMLPVYLMVRKLRRDAFIKQVNVDLDVVYHDIVFCGVERIREMPGYMQFYSQFSKLISKGKEYDEEKQEEWIMVANNGYINDNTIHRLMDFAITTQNITIEMIESALNQILDSVVVHNPVAETVALIDRNPVINDPMEMAVDTALTATQATSERDTRLRGKRKKTKDKILEEEESEQES